MSSLWSKLAPLPFEIVGVQRSAASLEVSPVFTRHTTTLELLGPDSVGLGEDVTYETPDQLAFQTASLPNLDGRYTLAEFSARLDELDLFFGTPPARETSRDYRRWTFESAALDLALKQNKLSLAAALGRAFQPVSFVASLGLGRPPSAEPILERLATDPGLQFKLDADEAWNAELCSRLAATGAIRTVDLKGYYTGTPVDLEASPELYALVAEHFPDAWIEDPVLDERTLPVLEAHADRLSFDAPIHRVADLAQFAIEPRCVNIKPSRSGRVQDLLELYEHCEANSLAMYSGGQFELGVGRKQVQQLASIFHPDACNDCSPVEYHTSAAGSTLPTSPIAAASNAAGFGA